MFCEFKIFRAFPSSIHFFIITLFLVYVQNKRGILVPLQSKYSAFSGIRFSICSFIFLFTLILYMAKPFIKKEVIEKRLGSIDIVIALDHSLSMRAKDQTPYRFKAAKYMICHMLQHGGIKDGDRIALFTFGSNSKRKLYLCPDISKALNILQYTTYPKKCIIQDQSLFRTDISLLLEHILQSLERQKRFELHKKYHKQKTLVLLFSDGDNTTPKTLKNVLTKYIQKNIQIYTFGMGSKKGVELNSLFWGYRELFDYPMYLKVQWQGLKTRLKERILQHIAQKTGGVYYQTAKIKKIQDCFSKIIKNNRIKRASFIVHPHHHLGTWLLWSIAIILLFFL